MIGLLFRRARAQWPLLVSLLAVLTIGATLLGACTLLVTRTSQRAAEVAAARAGADDTEVTAYTGTIGAADVRSVAADTRTVLTASVQPFAATTSTRASSEMRRLPAQSDELNGLLSEGYLSGFDGLAASATLLAGRWPRSTADGAAPGAPLEAVLFDNTARLLGLKVGSHEHLGTELGRFNAPELDVTVVGIVHPLPDAGWDRDVLGGAGFDPSPEDSAYAKTVNAYGPFLVTLDDLLASRSDLARLEVTAHPDLSAPAESDLDRLTGAVLGADRKLAGTLADRVQVERVASPLPQTLLATRDQQELTAGEVLALALIGVLLTAIALALAGRLTTGVRAEESALFTALGTSRGQFASVSAVEAAVLAGLAAVLAVPASSVLHALLTHLAPLKGAGLAARPAVTLPQLLAVAGGALALALLHVALAVRPAADSGDRRTRRELLARSGADVLLVALAGVGWWQLRSQPAAAGSRADAVRVLAPALLLIAGTALTLRLLPPALRLAERLAGRSRGTVLPLAAFQAARRPQAYAAGLLIGLACAAATFGTAFAATWDTSQHDQADLAVGTDLAITLDAPPVTGQSTAVAAATGGTLSPVAAHNIAVGQWLGGEGDAPYLVALDTRKAPALLRGRVDTSWARVAGPLAPPAPVPGPALPKGAAPTFSGRAAGGASLTVTPRLLLQDADGLRTPCSGPPVPLDGRRHAVPGCAPVDGLRLVAVALPVTGDASWNSPASSIDVTMTLPAGSTSPARWSAQAASPEAGQLTRPTAEATGPTLRMTASVQFQELTDSSRVLVATTFPDPGPVPVAVSAAFARDVNAHPGSKLSLTFSTTPVAAVVTEVVPAVPSAPGAAAALADVDTLSRALVTHGQFDSPVTGWWAGNPRGDATAKIAGLHLGKATTRTAETARLTGSPARASLPAVLRVLVAAAILLLLGGVVLHVACDVQLRALEVARLRGLGMSRRDIRAALLGEHTAVLLPLLVAGAAVGALATWVVAPLLIRSDTGAAPVPRALAEWPWPAESALIGLLVAGSALAVLAVVTVQARRADAAHLRVAS
ncbi:FtsX-like permease family protein [Actinoplanes sp. NPDC051411]|uniref:FtsX-like permease family protein n=1 Tax=Actinoplanes sp. NPDC051411 TaxID=3155522 RepID=UPI003413ECBD